MPFGHFRRIARTDLGLLTDLPQGHFRYSPRQTSGVAKTHGVVSHHIQMDLGVAKCRTSIWLPLGGPQNVLPRLGISRRTLGVSKSRWGVWLPLQMDLGGTVLPQGHFCTPPDRPRGHISPNWDFEPPPDPLPDFPVHRGHRISTYRLPIDNSLSFPCLDGQC